MGSKGKERSFLDMSYVFHKYNTSMGGTDSQDQNANYRISVRTRK